MNVTFDHCDEVTNHIICQQIENGSIHESLRYQQTKQSEQGTSLQSFFLSKLFI